MRLRRRFGEFEYMGVKEEKGDRKHLHIVFRGKYIAQWLISELWNEIHKSPIVDIRIVKARDYAHYLAKYLAKGIRNRYWASYNWVFGGWVKWSQKVKRLVGYYPSRSLITTLARLGEEKRKQVMKWLEAFLPKALYPDGGFEVG